jgi:hypothetical protein
MVTRGARGQATVETVGIAVAVVLAVAATTTWLLAAVRPPDRPPDVVAQVARPLGFPDGIRYWALPSVPLGEEGAQEPIGDILRSAGRVLHTGVRGYGVARTEFDRGFRRRLGERLREIADDPLGTPTIPDAELFTPEGLARVALARGGEFVAYVERVRRLPREQVVPTVAGDMGELAADALVEAGRSLLRRRIADAGRRHPRPPDPPPGAPAS